MRKTKGGLLNRPTKSRVKYAYGVVFLVKWANTEGLVSTVMSKILVAWHAPS